MRVIETTASRATGPAPGEPGAALAFARRRGAGGLKAVLVWQAARALFRLAFAASLALLAGAMITEGRLDVAALGGVLVALALSAGAGFMAEMRAARAETALAEAIRGTLEGALAAMRPERMRARPAGALIAGLQRHPDALAALVVGHAAARSMLAAGPLIAAAAIALVSWEAALALILATPVMIVFLAILGRMVKARAEAQEKAFGRLAAQFADRIRTLPTILASHGLAHERGKIEGRMRTHAASTMRVLRLAFLNAGVIDFFSSLSIAVLAVFLGLGHLGLLTVPGFTGLALWQSLFILIAAADYFAPFRRYAEEYHAKAEGEAAAVELDWYFGRTEAHEGKAALAKSPALDLPARGMVAISGPSGAGKSTLLRALAGIDERTEAAPALRDGIAWVATDVYVPEGTLADAIGWSRGSLSRERIRRAAARVGLLDEALLPGGLDAPIAEGGENLSGGQRMRIGVARALLSDGAVLADEPTAKLDPATAAIVRSALSEVAHERLVIIATHDETLIAGAARRYVLAPVAGGKALAA